MSTETPTQTRKTPTQRKKRGGERPSKNINFMILEFLYNKGPMTCRDLHQHIKVQPGCSNYLYKSIYTKLLELEKANLVTRDDQGVWYLLEGVTPQTLITGEKEMTTNDLLEAERAASELGQGSDEEEPGEEEPTQVQRRAARPDTPAVRTSGIALDQRSLFIKHMSDIGVSPKEAIPTITDIFFEGNIEDLNWLETVLKRHAMGYVTHNQRNLILGWWAKTRGLPYSEEDMDWPVAEDTGKKPQKGKARAEQEKVSKPIDPGQGWRVGKDRQGDWTALPGGELTYEEALDRAERRAVIASYGLGGGEDEGESAGDGDEGAPTRKGKRQEAGLVEKMMLKMVDHMFDGAGGKDSAADAKVEALQAQIEAMREDKLEERFERLEGLIAQAASRDPWDEYTRFQQQAQRFGYGPNIVTDNSPAVQLIKDSSDKLDKNVARAMGMMERMLLRSEEFTPEQTRTPGQREQKAGELLTQVSGRDKSRNLRRETFGF